ncbi:MAG: hypothetical protein LQ345_005075 [Seirophora villosa]|nr:MAG: hypothetical protein LQ345_005075 [Seirophora villosa]
MTPRWAVGKEDIDVWRDVGRGFVAVSGILEGGKRVLWRGGTSYMVMVRLRSPFSFLEGQDGGGLLPPLRMLGPKVRVEDPIMVAGNDDFILVRLVGKPGKPRQLRLDHREGVPLSEITGMEENIAGLNGKVSTVGIGDVDDIDKALLTAGLEAVGDAGTGAWWLF